MLRAIIALGCAMFLVDTSRAVELVGPPPRIIRLPTPTDAQAAALADLRTLPASEAVFQRYVWSQDQYYESKQLVSLTVNYVSRAGVIYRPALVKGGLVRVDLRRIAPRVEDLAEYLALWEEFAFDPSFATIITKDQIEQEIKRGNIFADVLEVGRKKVLVRCKPYTLDGVEQTSRWVSTIRLTGRHLDPKTATELELLTGSLAPVTESRYFQFRALSTIKEDGVYKDVFSGLYYTLSKIQTAKEAGKKIGTDEDLLFETVGIGDVDKKLTAEAIFERIRSDQRVAVFRSKVTGKPRRVDLFPALSKGQGGQGFLIVTHDIRDQDVDIATSPLANLANFVDAAREDIWTKSNGLQAFALFDGKGNLQEAAPDNVVRDSTIPAPHTNRLSGAISCIRCHSDGDGLKALTNDVTKLLRGVGSLDVFGDLDKKNLDKTIPDVLDRLAGQYAGNPDKVLRRGREDYIEAILRATGPWKEDKEAQTGIGRITGKAYESLWNTWYYEPVGASKALQEIGYDVPPKDAVATFREIVGKDPSGLEDVRIGAISMGLEINRVDFALVYSFIATRARTNEARMAAEKKNR